jgi:hypothetical protein
MGQKPTKHSCFDPEGHRDAGGGRASIDTVFKAVEVGESTGYSTRASVERTREHKERDARRSTKKRKDKKGNVKQPDR